jgi:hypothetical protein
MMNLWEQACPRCGGTFNTEVTDIPLSRANSRRFCMSAELAAQVQLDQPLYLSGVQAGTQ